MTSTTNLFRFEPAREPLLEDDQYTLIKDPRITIQVVSEGRAYAVNEYGPTAEDIEWAIDRGVFRSLGGAKAAALHWAQKLKGTT